MRRFRQILAGFLTRVEGPALTELNDTLLVELTGGQRGDLHEILNKLCSGETMPAAFDQLRG